MHPRRGRSIGRDKPPADAAQPARRSRSERRVRAELLRQAVRENVYTRQGKRLPPSPTPGRRWRLAAILGAASIAASLAAVSVVGPGTPTPEMPPPHGSHALEGSAATGDSYFRGLGGASRPAAPMPDDVRFAQPGPMDSAVLPLSVHRIVLDPGHGGRDVGTVAPGGLYEKDLALDIALRLRELLQQRGGVEVYMTREEDVMMPLRDRARYANQVDADLFVSIHLNWLVAQPRRGVETFFLGPTTDPHLVELTSRENRDSGYSLADARRLLDGIYLDLRQEQSRSLAGSVQRALHRTLAEENPDLVDRGVKPAPFLVLVATEMPAILAEVSSLSNSQEAKLMATDQHRENIARALYDGIDTYIMNLSLGDTRGRAHDGQEG